MDNNNNILAVSGRKNKVVGKILSGELGGYDVEIRCPHCFGLHIHHWVSGGDVRFCDMGKGRYQILIPQNNMNVIGHLIDGDLVVNCPMCGKVHHHGGAKLKNGDVVHLLSHCAEFGATGSYFVHVVDKK